MTDMILQIGASKLAISMGLAGLAWVAARRCGKPSLAHGLWLLPLAVLLVPPFVSIPVWSGGVDPVGPVAAIGSLRAQPTPSAAATLLGWVREGGEEALVWLWLAGTAAVLGWTLVRTLRFHRSLLSASEPAPLEVRRLAREIARRLGLTATPAVYATRAQLSPMVWWAGGQVRVLIPSKLLAEMEESELRCVLAHELAHVRRRDHVVRWLEWLACAAFWWNPVAWWARRRLRASEELCCDALAVAATEAEPRTYAGALLRVIDFISKTPAPGPLTFASTIDRCGRPSRLERRFCVIMTNRISTPTARWLRVPLRCGAVCLLAGGLVYCTDQSNLTSVDPALVPVEKEAVLHLDGGQDDPAADAPLRLRPHVMRKLIEAIATEHALPANLAEALGDAGEAALSNRTPADLFLAVTPDDGAGNSKVVELDLAGLRSATLEAGLSPRQAAAVRDDLARHLRVRSARNGFFGGMHIKCTGVEGSSVSSSEGRVVAGRMWCEEAETSQGKLRIRTSQGDILVRTRR
ncbi:M56 family metallopeptidase [Candidatus Palauibacter polyketidifaciens]|uniref:M56 family metallopeptidase n=1 Tax=Candidatus Palauibacter polyketidifaciens TaxID=3056740 RepID=UPI00239B26C9|nr:M56 family metallopeptidase [Candidatus Palauibacter polyketidifaciens]MDE2721231.1 M56 family metallopeptidase [Candidatus Palauibacter polyketidifaciens]